MSFKIFTRFLIIITIALPISETKLLPTCPDSPPPCLLQSVATQTVCQGGNASITATFQLPATSAQSIPPENLVVMHLDQIIIQGTELKGFLNEDEDSERWVISLLYQGDFLTFQASKSDLSQENEFYTQFALSLGDDVWETSPSVWFDIESCKSNSESTQVLPEEPITVPTYYATVTLNLAKIYTLSSLTIYPDNDDNSLHSTEISGEKHRTDKVDDQPNLICSSDETLKQMMSAVIALSVLTYVTLLPMMIIIYYLSSKHRKDTKDRVGIDMVPKKKSQTNYEATQIRMEGGSCGTRSAELKD